MALYADLWDDRASILVQAQQLILYVLFYSNLYSPKNTRITSEFHTVA